MKAYVSFFLIVLPAMIFAQHQPTDLLIGTYTNNGKSQGIYVYAFDPVTGSASLKSTAKSTNPSFLTLSADRKYVYVANENGAGEGAASAYAYLDRSANR